MALLSFEVIPLPIRLKQQVGATFPHSIEFLKDKIDAFGICPYRDQNYAIQAICPFVCGGK